MYTVAALYHFTKFDDPAALKGPLAAVCAAGDVMGTLLLAREGINGTIAGPRAGIDAVLAHYVDPADWDALIASPDVAVIDTRNDYEVAIGTFDGAIDPETKSFGEFPAWWEANKDRFHNKRIAMFCTGGIRCEKSTNYLIGQGVCVSPEGWHPEIPRRGARGGEFLGRRVFRL